MKNLKRKMYFLWVYLTDSSFRNYVDMNSCQEYLLEIKRMTEEKQRYEYHKIFGSDHPYPTDLKP